MSAVPASATSSQQNSQPDLVNILATDVNNRQLMAVSLQSQDITISLAVTETRQYLSFENPA